MVNVNRRYGVTDFVVGETGHVTGRVADGLSTAVDDMVVIMHVYTAPQSFRLARRRSTTASYSFIPSIDLALPLLTMIVLPGPPSGSSSIALRSITTELNHLSS